MTLTGNTGPAGQQVLLALQIWRDNVNAKGGLLGRPVELVYYDDQGSPAKTLATKPTQRSSAKSMIRPPSKQDKMLSLLRRKEGVSITAIMKATAWQRHSVHGFLAGVVRKKLNLNLQSEGADGKRIYRVVAGKSSSKAAAAKRKRGR